MAIKQTITYNSDNKYFAGFLNYILKEVKLKGEVKIEKNKIILIVDDSDEKKLSLFSKITSKYLPHSIFLQDIETQKVDEQIDNNIEFISPSYDIAPCARCIEKIIDPSSKYYLDDTIKCDHYSNIPNTKYQKQILYSPNYDKNSTLLLCNFTKIDELFILTNEEKKALFSIEKPTLKATIKDEKLKKLTEKRYINIKAPFDIQSSLNAINAKDSNIDYLFFNDLDETKISIVQKNILIIKDNKISSKLKNINEDKQINRFLNIAYNKKIQNSAIGAYLSVEQDISFIVSLDGSVKKEIIFQQFDLTKLFYGIKNDKNRSKLLDNFSKKYPTIIDKLQTNSNYKIFEVINTILQLSSFTNNKEAFENISDKSLEFRGNGGLKIDMNYIDKGFDYISFISSIMSFKLAETNTNYLAYSIFEAYGDLAISTMNQLKKRYNIDNFIIFGNMFENSVLTSRILSKFAINKPYFPKSFALDD